MCEFQNHKGSFYISHEMYNRFLPSFSQPYMNIKWKKLINFKGSKFSLLQTEYNASNVLIRFIAHKRMARSTNLNIFTPSLISPIETKPDSSPVPLVWF